MEIQGLILKCVAGVYELMTDDGVKNAYAAGKFRSKNVSPLPGDQVVLKLAERAEENHLIIDILPRKNELVRPPLANISSLLITMAVKKPNPDLKLADALVIFCRKNGIVPVVVVNKSDYDPAEAEKLAAQFSSCGIKTVTVSKEDPTSAARLREALGEGITCFCGQSAVGKSTMTNLLLGRDQFETGGLSKKTERGKHTTRHSELVPIGPKQYLADTPGFSLLELPLLSPEDFLALYTEYEPYAASCRFAGCSHISEPDCAVKQALEQGKLSFERYERYCELYAEVKDKWRKRYD